jgi:hypothetical protein
VEAQAFWTCVWWVCIDFNEGAVLLRAIHVPRISGIFQPQIGLCDANFLYLPTRLYPLQVDLKAWLGVLDNKLVLVLAVSFC